MFHSRDLKYLRSDVRANCEAFLTECKAAGLNVLVTETVRDEEYQRSLVAQGYASKNATVPTFHSTKAGLAFDICKNIKGHEYDDAAFFQKCGEIGEKVGFTWGGRWKSFPDRPHFQWDDNKQHTGAMIRAGKLPRQMPAYKAASDLSAYRAKIQAKAGLSDATLDYLQAYKYGADLLRKLAAAMG